MTRPQKKINIVQEKRMLRQRSMIMLAFVAIISLAAYQFLSVELNSQIAFAGSTLTPTVPLPEDTEVPTNTPIPPTSTPLPTNTSVPSTSTPVPPAPTATNPPVNSGGGSSNPPPSPTPIPTATTLPVQEIPELGASGATNIILLAVVSFLIVLSWTGYTVFQVTAQSKK